MKKSHKFDVLSTKGCVSCNKPIKQRLVEIKADHNIKRCYKCGRAIRLAQQNHR